MKKQKQVLTIPGFSFAGIHCGIKDDAEKKDLSAIYSHSPKTLVGGMFTQNKVAAPCVYLAREQLKKSAYSQLIVINSGIANACVGTKGEKDHQTILKQAAKVFSLNSSQVYLSSTGKIGELLPTKKILQSLKTLKNEIHQDHLHEAALGMMTTDQYPKYEFIKSKLGKTPYHLAVIAKGAGMLRPNMATMLAYIVTDLHLNKKVLNQLLKTTVNQTLNRITVDGDTSTNDSVFMMANGFAKNETIALNSAAYQKIQKQLTKLLEAMARQIALDGEGATKCCDLKVLGALSEADAKKVCYAVGNSLLVKTALFGCDPNWGRFLAACGYSGARVDPNKIKLKIGPYLVANRGKENPRCDMAQVRDYMIKNKYLDIQIDLGVGKAKYHVYMSDITYDYLHLNAEYHT